MHHKGVLYSMTLCVICYKTGIKWNKKWEAYHLSKIV
jgi:hypothetical protein